MSQAIKAQGADWVAGKTLVSILASSKSEFLSKIEKLNQKKKRGGGLKNE